MSLVVSSVVASLDIPSTWDRGSVVEYRAPASDQWLPALVSATSLAKDTLTLEFVMTGVPHEHCVQRSSVRLAALGIHEHSLPPSFFARPSKTRPGQLAYSDKVTGARYGSMELAWKVHLERVLRMEGLPTVCDSNRSGPGRFSWPEVMEPWADTLEPASTNAKAAFVRQDVGSSDLSQKSLAEAADSPHAPAPDACFCTDVFAELMAAPSPAAVPLKVFTTMERLASLDEYQAHDLTTATFPTQLCLSESANPCNNLFLPAGLVNPPQERVAELEGALEASRDRVRELEALQCDLSSQAVSVHSHCVHDHASLCPEVASQSHEEASQSQQTTDWESVESESCSAKEGVPRVEEVLMKIVAEENILKKAVEIADLHRTAHCLSHGCDSADDSEPCVVELQRQIQEREVKLLEVSQLHEKKEQDLECLRLALQAREQANAKFEEHLKDWEVQIHNTSPVAAQRKIRHSMPGVMCTPPKLPRAKPRALLVCGRTPPRSGSRSPPLPAGNTAGREAEAAAAAVAAVVARGLPAPPARPSTPAGTPKGSSCCFRGPQRSLSPARITHASHTSTPVGSSQGLNGYRTPRRALSPARITQATAITNAPVSSGQGFRTPRRSLSPATPSFCRRSSCGSVSVGSLRSGHSGGSTTAPSSAPESSTAVPESAQQLFPEPVTESCYTGVLTHPSFGTDEVPIEVTLVSASEGFWNAMNQNEKISVQRDAKNIVLSDKAGKTILDGYVMLGGNLVGIVTQNGVRGGRFRLQPCQKTLASGALLKRTCLQQQVRIPVVTRSTETVTTTTTRWRAVGIPAKMAVQSSGEAGWRTTYQVAFT